ncbi:hypothetical protein [Haloarcula marina]|uniref:hypothetical protein n=1 Tax=Haloarcula marina TaxID=2961574 RepID=UPI0020B6C934|nr:hypothetical protein [Halomicroarcula marina]
MTSRLIRYILLEDIDEVADAVDEGVIHQPDDEDFRFKSHAHKLVDEPKHLWLSHRDD